MSNQLIFALKETTESINATRRPWRDCLDLSAFCFPSSVTDATTRITQNLTHFRVNYTIVLLLIVSLSLITHPFALIIFYGVLLAWFFLYFSREEPLRIFNFTVDDGVLVVLLLGFTIAALVLTHVWVKAFVSSAIGVGLVVLHAALRGTDDMVMDDLESPYGPMLSGDESPQGVFTVL